MPTTGTHMSMLKAASYIHSCTRHRDTEQLGKHSHSGRLTVDAAVGAVRAPALLLCHVDLDVADLQHIHVQALHLHSVDANVVSREDSATLEEAADKCMGGSKRLLAASLLQHRG
jgi:hypothetical protein